MDLKTFKAYMSAYDNPSNVMFRTALNKFPFIATLRNGLKVQVRSKRHAYFFTTLRDLDVIYLDDRFIQFRYTDKVLKFYFDINDFVALGEIFRDGIYDVDVKGRVVVDVGAGIGDSPIYFALNGAKKVYAFEVNVPYLEKMEKNIRENDLKDVIEPIRCECGLSNNLDVITLKYNIPYESVLKVDCEGCEYGFFSTAPPRSIGRYQTIIIEYHEGVQHLEDLLRASGFNVTVKGNKKIGLIYARRLTLGVKR
jgi:methyltransferase, FkbM family